MNAELLFTQTVLIVVLLLLIHVVRSKPADRLVLAAPPSSSTCRAYNGKDTLLIPLYRDHNNIFLMDLKINGSWIKAVADSGSSKILVSGSDCQNCTMAGEVSKVRYGSQASTVQQETATITLDTYRYACNQNFESSVAAMPFAADKKCLTTQANLNVALDFRGTSKYNIVGLNTQSEFLKKMLPFSPRAYSIHVRGLSDARMMLYRPGIDCHVANHFITDGRGMVQIQGLKVNGRDADRVARSVLVDTGSNALSVPSPLYQSMPPRGHLTIRLLSVKGKPFRLRVPYDKRNYTNAQVLEEAQSRRIVVGVTFLAGYAVGLVQQGNIQYVTLDRLE